jgi:hypothetical protein
MTDDTDDSASNPLPGDDEAVAEPAEGQYPWDEPPADPADPSADRDALPAEASAQEGPRQRHDAFTEARKAEYLTVLVKTGCIQDACRRTGVSPRTVYRHQQADPRFFDHCAAALRMSATPVELTAWQRAVEGVEQEFACGGQVHVRRRYDTGLLRLLLQGSNPKKYGPRPGFKRKRLLKHERKQMEREIKAEIAARDKKWTFEEAIVALDRQLDALGFRDETEKLATGWTRSPEGHWVPPGYGPLPGYCPVPGAEGGATGAEGGTPRDSM